MAKDRRKLQHMHSSIPDKQPTPASLEVGEIAVNNAKDKEFLSIKNSNDKVVRFSSDGQIIEWMERKEVMPYKGYVRGDGGPAVTSGDTPTPDAKGSYGISNDDLLNNKSELVFKLNQVAANLTTKHDKVNGAKDMYNEEINPTDDYGINDGAGFFIDMSRYAMRDGNPSFSALTATCQTRLSGNTYISDGASANTYGTDTGHTLDIKVTDTVASGVTWGETLSAKTEDISGRTTVIGNDGEKLTVSGTTTEVHNGNVSITNNNNVVENTSGTTTETKKGIVTENNLSAKTENTTGDHNINVSGETCIISQKGANLYGKIATNIGVACDGDKSSMTNVVGKNLLYMNGNTINETGNTVNVSAATNVNISADTICESAKTEADFYAPKTQIGISCGGSTATTVNISGTTINEGGTNLNQNVTNYDLNGANICISGSTKTDVYGKETNIGVDCGGTTATTVNVSGITINEGGTTNNNTFTIVNNTATTINNNTTNYNITGTTNISGNTTIDGTLNVSGVTTIGDTLIIKEGLEKKLSWTYGDVRQENSGETNFKTDESFVIPKSIDDLTNWNNTCITLPHNVCVDGTITASQAIYSSDRNLKENITFISRNEFNKVTAIPFHSFNLKSDVNKTKMYGIIAQEVQDAGLGDIVYTKEEDGTLAVDYTSLLILHIAYLQDLCGSLNGKIIKLEEKLNKLENKN